jgi:hypothetical protein
MYLLCEMYQFADLKLYLLLFGAAAVLVCSYHIADSEPNAF